MSAMASWITSLTIVYSTVYSGADQRKHPSSVLLAFVRGIHWWPVNFPHKGPLTRQMLPFDDVIMIRADSGSANITFYGHIHMIRKRWNTRQLPNTPTWLGRLSYLMEGSHGISLEHCLEGFDKWPSIIIDSCSILVSIVSATTTYISTGLLGWHSLVNNQFASDL